MAFPSDFVKSSTSSARRYLGATCSLQATREALSISDCASKLNVVQRLVMMGLAEQEDERLGESLLHLVTVLLLLH